MKSISNTNNRKNSFLKLAASLFGVLFISVTLGCSFIFDELSGGGSGNSNYDDNIELLLNETFDKHSITPGFRGSGRITKDNVFAKRHNNNRRARRVLEDWEKHGNVYELKKNTSLSVQFDVYEDSVISFDYKSDLNYSNGLSVYIDDKKYSKSYGGYNNTWEKVSIELQPGRHKVKWIIPNLAQSSAELENVVYIDNITVVSDKVAYVDIYPKGLQETYVNGDPIQFTAKAVRGDGSIKEDVSVIYSVTGCGDINRNGLFTPNSEGVCTVTAKVGRKTAENKSVKVHQRDYLRDPVTIAGHKFTGTINYGKPVNTLNIRFDTPMPSSADGFFVIKGNTNYPFLIRVTKQGSTPGLETTFFVREAGEFYKRIWLRFGAGTYNVFISEISQLELRNPIGNYEGDIFKYGYFNGGNRTCAFNVTNTNSSMTEEEATYLMPSEVVQSDCFIVSNVSNAVMAEFTNEKYAGNVLRAFHDWILYNFYYDMASVEKDGIYRKRQDSEHVIRYETGVCEGYANLYAALVRKVGIKARVICDLKTLGHAWNQIYYDKKWYLVDATWDDPVPKGEGMLYNDISKGREIYTFFMVDPIDGKHSYEDEHSHEEKEYGAPELGRSVYPSAVIQPSMPKMTNMPDGWY